MLTVLLITRTRSSGRMVSVSLQLCTTGKRERVGESRPDYVEI